MTKICTKCDAEKPLNGFRKQKSSPDGHTWYCKSCLSANYELWRSNNYEQKVASDRRYLKSEAGKQSHLKSAYRYWAKFPEKQLAHRVVKNALAAGKLTKSPCEMCGELKVEAHHDDYSKPLDIRWLCNFHHREIEGRNVLTKTKPQANN